MAGKGSRFAKAGYKTPKPFIDVCGKPMIQVVVDNLTPSCDHRFIFICQNEHLDQFNGRQLLNSIAHSPIIIGIDGYTEGQLSSALLARSYIDNEDPLMTANTDQFIDFSIDQYLGYMKEMQLDGLIMTMDASDPKWSYVELSQETGMVERTAEKEVISNQATVGIYNFAKGKDFCRAADELISENIRTNGEFYICPVFNSLIKDGCKIGTYNIGQEGNGMYGLGIPDDLKKFLESEVSRKVRTQRCR